MILDHFPRAGQQVLTAMFIEGFVVAADGFLTNYPEFSSKHDTRRRGRLEGRRR